MSFQQLLNTIHPKKLFLIDSLGALLSALLLGVVLASLESTFGMPPKVLYVLASIAGIFCIHSFLCYSGQTENWRSRMRIIAIANLLYCGLTAGLIIALYPRLTGLGLLYFVLEIMVVAGLAVIELKAASRG